jgi:hypothetical protein
MIAGLNVNAFTYRLFQNKRCVVFNSTIPVRLSPVEKKHPYLPGHYFVEQLPLLNRAVCTTAEVEETGVAMKAGPFSFHQACHCARSVAGGSPVIAARAQRRNKRYVITFIETRSLVGIVTRAPEDL